MSLNTLAIIAVHVFIHLVQGTHSCPEHSSQVSVETVALLDPDVQPENLILRPNNQLLVTSASVPALMQIDPFAEPNQTVQTIARFENYASTTGIVGLKPDVFAVAVGNYSGTPPPHGTIGTWHIYLVDLRGYGGERFDSACVRVEMVVAAPQISDIDGLALINGHKGLLAASDFTAGVIWLLNVRTGEASLLAQDAHLAPATPYDPANPTAVNDTDALASIGANGLKFNGSDLHFTNFAEGLYGTISIDPETGLADGPVETTFDYGFHLDDIAITKAENVYLTTYDIGLGVIRRKPGTRAHEKGSGLVMDVPGANAVLPKETSKGCTLYVTKALAPYSIVGGHFEGPC